MYNILQGLNVLLNKIKEVLSNSEYNSLLKISNISVFIDQNKIEIDDFYLVSINFNRIFNVKTGKMKCELDCNKKGTETLVQAIKWRPKIEGRTNNILMAICNDTVTEWHTQSSKLLNYWLSL